MPDRSTHRFTVADLLDDSRKFRSATLRACWNWAMSKPWKGPLEAQKAKLLLAHAELAPIYGLTDVRLDVSRMRDGESSDASYFDPETRTIVLVGQASVVTHLNMIGAARGKGTRERFAWSVNLFRRCFPLSFAACIQDGPFLRNPSRM